MSVSENDRMSRVRSSSFMNRSIQLDEHIVHIPPSPVRSHAASRMSELAPQHSRAASSMEERTSSDDPDDEDGYFGIHRPQSIRQKGRRRLRNYSAGESGLYSEGGSLTWLGRVYEAVWSFSLVTRYMIYIFPLGLILSIPIFVGAFGATDASLGGVRIVWIFVWVEIVWVSMWIAKLFAKILPIIFETVVGIIKNSVSRFALILMALEMPITLVSWAFVSWITFIPIMTGNPDQRRLNDRASKSWETRLDRVLAALLVGSTVLLIERFLIQLISVNYHRKQFAIRIKQYKRNIYLFTKLFDISRTLFPLYCPEFVEEDYLMLAGIASELVTPSGNNGQSTTMKIIGNIGRVGDRFTSAIGNVAHEITGNNKILSPQSSKAIVTAALERRVTSEAMAKRIWMSLVPEDKAELDLDDLREVVSAHLDESSEFAEECMGMLDKDGNGDVSLDEIVFVFLELGREKKSVSRSMHDVDSAINVLDNVLTAVAMCAAIFILIAFMNQNFGTMLATAGTVLLSMSFVFATTAAELLSSCIFLFVKHPYDVGDRVDITGNKYIVDHISLLYTVFRQVDNNKNVQVPNSVLNTLWVENVSRSLAMQEVIAIPVHFDTTMHDIEVLHEELVNFVKCNSRDFYPEVNIAVSDIPALDRMELRFTVRHKSNMANETLRIQRQNKFMCELIAACKKVPLYPPNVGDPPLGSFGQPTYSVMISDQDAQQRFAKAMKEKDDLKFKPQPADAIADADVSAVSRKSTGVVLTNSPRLSHGPRDSITERNTEIVGSQDIVRRQTTTTGRRKPGAAGATLSPHITSEKDILSPQISREKSPEP
ncbi:Mechanosensitive ion channel-domain-containing protein [Lipomyces chichibuensis]|uniref:Mechanosensitive ion channel-domain-containing protein n=1 Tax=Lipomyces chichibuensis TaxID=1546026 RepID=UPI0033439203